MSNQEQNAANLLMLWELGEVIGPYRGSLLSDLNAAVDKVVAKKVCSRCKVAKDPERDFPLNKLRNNLPKAWCFGCTAAYSREWRNGNASSKKSNCTSDI